MVVIKVVTSIFSYLPPHNRTNDTMGNSWSHFINAELSYHLLPIVYCHSYLLHLHNKSVGLKGALIKSFYICYLDELWFPRVELNYYNNTTIIDHINSMYLCYIACM